MRLQPVIFPVDCRQWIDASLALLMAGGLAYTLGTVLHALHRIPFAHFWWHLVVLAGSALHFLAILLYVIPR